MTRAVIDVNNASFDCFFVVFIHFDYHVSFCFDVMLGDPRLYFVQPFACSHSADQLIGHSQKYCNQSSAHREVVVLE